MDTKNIVIICIAVIIIIAISVGFLMSQQGSSNNTTNVTNTTNTTNATNVTNATNGTQINTDDTSSAEVEEVNTNDGSYSNEPEQIDYNSPDSDYYKWDTDGSYHKKQDGVKYVYAQDAVTGEWSYWVNKSA